MSVRSVNLERLGLLADLVLFEPRRRLAQVVERRARNPKMHGFESHLVGNQSDLSKRKNYKICDETLLASSKMKIFVPPVI